MDGWMEEMHISTATALLQQILHVSWYPGPLPTPRHAFLLFSTWFKIQLSCLPDLMTGVEFISYFIWFSFPWFLFLCHVSVLPVYRMETWSESKQSNTVSVHDITLKCYAWAISPFIFYIYYRIIQQSNNLILTSDGKRNNSTFLTYNRKFPE